jgi:hypothetical protein
VCEHLKLPDGGFAIICGGHRAKAYCACGRPSQFLCDWKVPGRKSGTCDKPICAQHALNVAPDRDLCPEHQREFELWKRRHPGVDVNDLRRNTLGPPETQKELFDGKL